MLMHKVLLRILMSNLYNEMVEVCALLGAFLDLSAFVTDSRFGKYSLYETAQGPQT